MLKKVIHRKIQDYVVIGAGSAGCVVANRLSENPDSKVTLIEAGKSDVGHWDSWKIQMPAALTYNLANEKYNWFYETENQQNLKNRQLHWPRGKCLGGSSSHNAMVYVRGNAGDFDRWEQEGATHWNYQRVLPYFKKSQTHEMGEDHYKGGDGPLHTTKGKTRNILFEKFIDAGVQTGYQYNEDMNGCKQEGFGFKDMNIYKGRRWNTSNAYLRGIGERRNLDIQTQVFVNRILFENVNNKLTAIGVECEQNGQTIQYIAEKEVVLSAGAINSPQILQLSGIGDHQHLERLGIQTLLDHQEIGNNLQDHVEVYMQYKCLQNVTVYNSASLLRNPINTSMAGLQWFMYQDGICASNQFESGGFIRSDKGIQYPDIQYHFIPAAVHGQLDLLPYEAFQLHVGTLRPKSRGRVQIKSKDPKVYPSIQPNLFEHPQDIDDFLKTIHLSLELMQSSSFKPYKGDSINFSSDDMKDDQSMINWFRQNVESAYHASCTLPMGTVVDPQGKFIGIDQLRICDASIMPSITSGNLNAVVVMLAEKVADSIKGKLPLSTANVPQQFNPNWATSQR